MPSQPAWPCILHPGADVFLLHLPWKETEPIFVPLTHPDVAQSFQTDAVRVRRNKQVFHCNFSKTTGGMGEKKVTMPSPSSWHPFLRKKSLEVGCPCLPHPSSLRPSRGNALDILRIKIVRFEDASFPLLLPPKLLPGLNEVGLSALHTHTYTTTTTTNNNNNKRQ
jgi:hypothetical protein